MFKRKGKRPARKSRKGRKGGTKINRSQLGLMPSVQNKNYAMITESYEIGDVVANASYSAVITIAAFQRAVAMARLFKFYRLAKVVFDYNPDANTYQAGGSTTETIPFMYYNMNRDGAFNADQSLDQLKAAGARPIKFTKKIVIAYKPNLVQLNQIILTPNTNNYYNGNNTPVYDKWISTVGLQNAAGGNKGTVDNPPSIAGPSILPSVVNVVPYQGHNFYFEQSVTPSEAGSVGFATVTCMWEFKEPVLYAIGSE